MGEPHDVAPRGSQHLSCVSICTGHRAPQGPRVPIPSVTPPKESATVGLHLKGVAGIIRNIDVAYPSTALYLVAEESTHGSRSPNTQRHDQHRSDRKAGRAPRPTHARVARPHERGRVWQL